MSGRPVGGGDVAVAVAVLTGDLVGSRGLPLDALAHLAPPAPPPAPSACVQCAPATPPR